MRLLIIALSVLKVAGYAQGNQQGTINVKRATGNDSIYSSVEQMPVFQGGDARLLKFIQANFVYPKTALENGISGTTYLTFTINRNGNIENAKVLRGIPGCPECDEEALRIVNLMPAFIPGKKDGTPVSVQFNLPLRFRLK